jgi:hypothetical protein
MSEIKRGRGRPRKSEAEKLAAAEARAAAKAEAIALETPALASPRPGRELVACPFCGSEKCEIRERGRAQFVPRCFACDARLGLFSSKAEARAAWNTRVGGMVPVRPEAVPAPFESCPPVEALAPAPVRHSIDLSNRNDVAERAPGVFEVLLPGSVPPPADFDVGF